MNEKSFEELFNEKQNSYRRLKVGDKVKGKVIFIGEESTFVDIGNKSDGIIDTDELRDDTGEVWAKENDEIEAYVVSFEAEGIELSRALSGDSVNREMLLEAFEKGIPVEGKVTKTNKGGFVVDVMNTRAFCPISQMDDKFVEDPEFFLNKILKFKISSMERGSDVIVSRRDFLNEEKEFKAEIFMKKYNEGDILEAEITRITEFGAFADLGGVEGLIHISEIDWDNVENVRDFVKEKEKIRVKIIGIDRKDPKNPRISLSIKQTKKHPFYQFAENHPVGSVVKGKIRKLMSFGAFVNLTPGVDGLLHISEISGERRINNPGEVLTKNDEIEVMIIGINREKKELQLSIKALAGNPWETADDLYPAGKVMNGTIENITQHGLFVKIAPGLIGLLHVSKLGDKKSFKIGEEIEVSVISLDSENKKISLDLAKGSSVSAEETDWQQYSDNSGDSVSQFGSLLQNALKKK